MDMMTGLCRPPPQTNTWDTGAGMSSIPVATVAAMIAHSVAAPSASFNVRNQLRNLGKTVPIQ
jgi:hypothetical protein